MYRLRGMSRSPGMSRLRGMAEPTFGRLFAAEATYNEQRPFRDIAGLRMAQGLAFVREGPLDPEHDGAHGIHALILECARTGIRAFC